MILRSFQRCKLLHLVIPRICLPYPVIVFHIPNIPKSLLSLILLLKCPFNLGEIAAIWEINVIATSKGNFQDFLVEWKGHPKSALVWIGEVHDRDERDSFYHAECLQ
ncbi:uncharacterized protein LOC110824808 isoform X1 [Carica papaya]|uniref:uncharacterized protein LOC110824808 isoform X1 n=1 Tax=Carica papaya TaxID=3649 RepID=UPI000B8C7531|nr:uncharacterized protein LOC110824808 isoform X1 [Carica papaya]